MDLLLAESVAPQSSCPATINKKILERMLPAGDQEKSSTEIHVIANSAEGQLKQSLLPASSFSSPSDGVLDLCAESGDTPRSPPLPGLDPEGDTSSQQTKDWICGSA